MRGESECLILAPGSLNVLIDGACMGSRQYLLLDVLLSYRFAIQEDEFRLKGVPVIEVSSKWFSFPIVLLELSGISRELQRATLYHGDCIPAHILLQIGAVLHRIWALCDVLSGCSGQGDAGFHRVGGLPVLLVLAGLLLSNQWPLVCARLVTTAATAAIVGGSSLLLPCSSATVPSNSVSSTLA